MARRADDFRSDLLVEDENSGVADDALAAAFSDWLRELDEQPAVQVLVRAADTLAEARADGEV